MRALWVLLLVPAWAAAECPREPRCTTEAKPACGDPGGPSSWQDVRRYACGCAAQALADGLARAKGAGPMAALGRTGGADGMAALLARVDRAAWIDADSQDFCAEFAALADPEQRARYARAEGALWAQRIGIELARLPRASEPPAQLAAAGPVAPALKSPVAPVAPVAEAKPLEPDKPLSTISGALTPIQAVAAPEAGKPEEPTYVRAETLASKSQASCANPVSSYKQREGAPAVKSAAALESGISCTPSWLGGDGLAHYMDMTSLRNYGSPESVGASNEALIKYLERRSAEDPEYRAQLRQLYGAVNEQDLQAAANGISLHKPTLNEKAGYGAFSRVEPGWLWKQAMKASNNDPNRAMELVGFCGHDDYYGLPTKVATPMSADDRMVAMESRRRTLLEEIRILETTPAGRVPKKLQDEVKWRNGDVVKVIDDKKLQISQLQEQDFGVRLERVCPPEWSTMYLPGSFDASADIPRALKDRIAGLQAPTKGASALPAKYYHVMGGAFGACEMIRKGTPGFEAKWAEAGSAWSYRTIRLTQQSSQALAVHAGMVREYHELLAKFPTAQNPSEEEFLRTRIKQALAEHDPAVGLNTNLAQLDAYYLMEQWGYTRAGVATDLPLGARAVAALGTGGLYRYRPSGWSDKRYEEAKRKVDTFMVDTEWTVAQHDAGADFARRVCKKD